MNIEDTLRDVLQAEASSAAPEPSEATWRAIERRAGRRRAARWAGTSALAAAAAVVVAVLVVGGGDSSPTRVDVVPADPSTSSTRVPNTTTTTTPTTEDSVVGRPGVGFVFTAGLDDPLETVRRFAADYLQMPAPELRAGPGATSDYFSVRPNSRYQSETVVFLWTAADGTYFVTGAWTGNIDVETPEEKQTVGTATVRVAGRSTAFEGTVRVQVRQRDGRVLGGGIVMGGANGEMGIFTGDITIESPTTDTGAVVFFTESAEDGSVQEATVIPVTFAR
jgi:hypothetical protein